MSQRIRIEAELVEQLTGLPLMQQPSGRQQLVQELRRRLDHRVALHNVEEPRRQSQEVVTACAPVPAALAVVVDVVVLFAPVAWQVNHLRRLQQEWEVADALLDEDWSQLRQALVGVRPSNPGRLYQLVTGHQLSSPGEWCEHAWDMFVQLSGQNAPSSGLPPGMLFLLLLEPEVDASVAALIYRRNQRQASQLGLTEQFDRRRATMNVGPSQPFEPCVYLVIQVEPEQEPDGPLDERLAAVERYDVSHYRQWYGDGCWHSRLHGRIAGVAYAELTAVVEQVIRLTEEEWSDRRDETVIEFVLPIQLLNEDVAWWRKEPARDYLAEKVLAMDYPVVVRSLERIREKGWHHAWRRRWRQLQADPVRSQPFRCQREGPSGSEYTQLEAALSSDPRCLAVLLSEPPVRTGASHTGLREVMTALRAGIPVILWHRTQPASDALWEEVRQLTVGGNLSRLPMQMKLRRLAALRFGRERRPDHLGWHLAVLWDDPDRLPELDQADGSAEGVTDGRP